MAAKHAIHAILCGIGGKGSGGGRAGSARKPGPSRWFAIAFDCEAEALRLQTEGSFKRHHASRAGKDIWAEQRVIVSAWGRITVARTR
jgi:hypothetical protein